MNALKPVAVSLAGINFSLPVLSEGHESSPRFDQTLLARFRTTDLISPDYTIVFAGSNPSDSNQPVVTKSRNGAIHFGEGRLDLVFRVEGRWRLSWEIASERMVFSPLECSTGTGANLVKGALYAVRSVMPFVLAVRRGLFLHAAGVVRDGCGLLFIGPSGAGKSTIARLLEAAGGEILSDERTLLRYDDRDGCFHVYGSPWPSLGTRRASAASAPLKGIFLLAHGARHDMEPVSAAQAFRHLCADPGFFFPRSAPAFLNPMLTTLDSLLRSVPPHRLSFTPTSDVAGFVLKGIHS
ncbi:MAG: hypothetical protein PHR35_18285 [Kiritimatiellae bacterium]|nr:hypothetical protein [Kiritimatiellia bacterium]